MKGSGSDPGRGLCGKQPVGRNPPRQHLGKQILPFHPVPPHGIFTSSIEQRSCRLGATQFVWKFRPGVDSWCAIKKILLPLAALALVGAALPAPPAEQAASRTVSFSVDPLYCPKLGVYGISHVTVQGTGDLRADQNFIWTTQTAEVTIGSVPPEGAFANVTVTYRCIIRVLWWQEAGRSQYVTATRWVKGAGKQPGYTLAPENAGTQVP